ncbi:MAG: hypothetical protein LBR88_02370, partial [Zoogloeaceae bacterium]|nr:hypothetical protein [Zoogloeaceae bacterium]
MLKFLNKGYWDAPRVTVWSARKPFIHGHIFQEIYEWVGKPRTVPSSKGMGNGMVSVFANPEEIVPAWRELEKKTQAFASARGLTFA